MPDQYSYYADENDNAIEMDHFKALQLDKSFFEPKNFDSEQLKEKYKKLALAYHPDKNNNALRAKIAFQRVTAAYECLSDPQKRANYILHGDEQFIFDEDYVYKDVDTLFRSLVGKIGILSQRLEKLLAIKEEAKKGSDAIVKVGAQDQSADSLEKITLDFADEYSGGAITGELHAEQIDLFNRIKEQVKTAGELYALHQVIWQDRYLAIPHGTKYLQMAAAQHHPLAMCKMIGGALAGGYKPLEKSISWALNALKELEGTIIPNLEQSDPTSKDLSKLKQSIAEIRERQKEILPVILPDDLEDLVQKYMVYRQGVRGGNSFEIETTFVHNANLEVSFVKSLLFDFEQKINDTNKDASPKAIKIARSLKNNLSKALDTYKENKLSDMPLEEAKTVFVDTCARHINLAKPLLEKELGWGDYLTNLLKTIANFFIRGANKLTVSGARFSLFEHAKAPFVTEAEEINDKIEKNIGPSGS